MLMGKSFQPFLSSPDLPPVSSPGLSSWMMPPDMS